MEPDIHNYQSLLAEYSLFGLFEALGIQQEWEVGYPIDCEYVADTGIITPEPIGRRLDIKYKSGGRVSQTEIDGLVSIRFNGRNSWVVLEAKSGVKYPSIKEIQNQVRAVRTVTGNNPHYVLGVPKDNKLLEPEDYNKDKRDEFTSKGGIIITFDESVEEFESNARSMYENTMDVMKK